MQDVMSLLTRVSIFVKSVIGRDTYGQSTTRLLCEVRNSG